MKKIELLAPAGNFECLKAAVLAGCNAVYLGGKLFGARSFAGNFSDDELVRAIKYAHLYGVKVYLTINTIVYEKEVERFINYVRFAHLNNVDAVIIQDLGMLDLVRKKFPNLEVHTSTQMHVHNVSGAMMAKKLGVKRVVVARETSLETIKKIKQEAGAEVEVFIHGALCVSYSGQCLMSALIGNRSGNRGTCTQACRKKYNLYDDAGNLLNKDEYLLSTKDLCTLKYLDKIIMAGADSLKIEGRMKRPQYVYLVTSIYRKVIDNYYATGKISVSDKDIVELKKMFNREFTKGFMLNVENDSYVNQVRPNHQGVKIGKVTGLMKGYLKISLTGEINAKDGLRIVSKSGDFGILVNKMFVNKKAVTSAHSGTDVYIRFDDAANALGADVLLTTDANQLKKIDDDLKNLTMKVPIDLSVRVKDKMPLLIRASDGKNEVSYELEGVVQKAVNHPVDKAFITKQVTKTGDTCYAVKDVKIELDNGVFVNLKDVNLARRKVLSMLDERRLYKTSFAEKDYFSNPFNHEVETKRSCLLNTKLDYEKYKDKYDVIYTDNKSLLKYSKVLFKTPRVIDNYDKCLETPLIGELGGMLNYDVFDTDFSFNVVNSYTVSFLHEMGARKVTLSHELSLEQVKNIVDAYHKRYHKHPNLEVITEGYEEAMICKFDLNKMYKINFGHLEDEYKNRFKVVSNKDFMTVYNYRKRKMAADKYYAIGVNSTRVNLA
ncbi:MAG: U32 family peptidase [Bacilli bacterium]|nr:U32 family peptidase [Bacilli bacterium]